MEVKIHTYGTTKIFPINKNKYPQRPIWCVLIFKIFRVLDLSYILFQTHI